MLGYFFYGASTLFYILLIVLNFNKPRLSGDGAMGYGLGLFFFGVGFAICSLILTLSVSWKNGFDWIAKETGTRTLLWLFGWFTLTAATFMCAAFKWEWHKGEFPEYLHWIATHYGQTWLPLLALFPFFILLSPEMRANVVPNLYKIPLIVGFAISTLMTLGGIYGWLRASAIQQARIIEQRAEDNDRLHNGHLEYIASQKLTDPIVNILALTGRFHDDDVRDSAIAKVKSHPQWEKEMIELLGNEHYFNEVYTFIDGNKVENPDLFLEPLNKSILMMAKQIHDNIKHSNNLQDWHFEHYGIERLFRAIDEQFVGRGMDFKPAVLKLQDALNTTPPERFNDVKFTVSRVVSNWLKKH